jgi:aspartate ammonia-lyase
MVTRTEVDSIGKRQVPKNVYYGIQTLRAQENFVVSDVKAPREFVYAYTYVKKAAAMANMKVGWLDEKIGEAITRACDEILEGKFLDQFVVDVFQAGAGTSFNMNVNEVLANRTLEILNNKKGNYRAVSPNDHVNMGQSSNDTFPTALNVSILLALKLLLNELALLSTAFRKRGKKYAQVIKSGRTHLQDALPITIGQEFGAYASAIQNCRRHIEVRSRLLHEIALGGTAVGTGVNAHPQFKKMAISELSRLTGLKLKPSQDSFEALQSQNGVVAVSSGLKELALELIRIANDLRLLSSGPTAGLAEIMLPPVQPGSSIMPGKVNPVMAECLDMICFQIVGNDLTVSLAAQAGQLELNVMTPIMMHNLLESIRLLSSYLPVFREKCVKGITVDKKRCLHYLEMNPALATFLSPLIGHLEASKIAKQALKEERTVREVVAEKSLLKHDEVERIFSSAHMLGIDRTTLEKPRKKKEG